jgi:hypothetical protein
MRPRPLWRHRPSDRVRCRRKRQRQAYSDHPRFEHDVGSIGDRRPLGFSHGTLPRLSRQLFDRGLACGGAAPIAWRIATSLLSRIVSALSPSHSGRRRLAPIARRHAGPKPRRSRPDASMHPPKSCIVGEREKALYHTAFSTDSSMSHLSSRRRSYPV